MNPQVRFCRTADGVRIAFAVAGHGPPLLLSAGDLAHLESEWRNCVRGPWLRELAGRHKLVRYDPRGRGLSDPDPRDVSLEARLRDLEAVMNAAGIARGALLGQSQDAALAVLYAVRHAERLTHLVLLGGSARGALQRSTGRGHDSARTAARILIDAMRVGWDLETPAYRQLFSRLLMPRGSAEEIACLNDLSRRAVHPRMAARAEEAAARTDVSEQVPRVSVPTLVLHARRDARAPFEEGRRLASSIPDARFVPLESPNHVLSRDEPAAGRRRAEIAAFLGGGECATPPREPRHLFPDLTPRERRVLSMIARGYGNEAISERLSIATKTTRNHVTRIYRKLRVGSRAKAIVMAREAGL